MPDCIDIDIPQKRGGMEEELYIGDTKKAFLVTEKLFLMSAPCGACNHTYFVAFFVRICQIIRNIWGKILAKHLFLS
jgi:hypothetical protein